MEYTGYAPSWDRVVFRGEPATREFVAFYMTGDRVSAALNANVWEVTEPLKALVTSKRPVRDAQLADSGVPIDALVGAAA
jgi:3-phenylpropionate/trans-cinnamate dioxygenase ferredoxin reductase component